MGIKSSVQWEIQRGSVIDVDVSDQFVCTIICEKGAFSLVQHSRTYVTSALDSVYSSFVGHIPSDIYIDLLGRPYKPYLTCETVE